MAVLGTRDNPYLMAPTEWATRGLPYGAFCKCHHCGLVARSTATFDYYADMAGDPLTCEGCQLGVPKDLHHVTDMIAEQIRRKENSNGVQ